VIQQLVPNTPDALGDEVRIRGFNFGWEETTVEIFVNGLECTNPEWLNDATLSCRTPSLLVGPANVSVLVANRTQPWQI